MTEIETLVGVYYTFCNWPNNSDYVAGLLETNKFFFNDIENVSSQRHCEGFYTCKLTNYI